jgi:hypothetical protein
MQLILILPGSTETGALLRVRGQQRQVLRKLLRCTA